MTRVYLDTKGTGEWKEIASCKFGDDAALIFKAYKTANNYPVRLTYCGFSIGEQVGEEHIPT